LAKPNRLSDGECIRINQAIFSLRNVYESRMRSEGQGGDDSPTIAELGVLMVLGQAGEINARALSRMMDMTPGTISQYLSRLARRGLVNQRRDEKDRRTWWLTLTEDGEETYRTAYEGTVRYTESIIACLNKDEQRTLHDLLVKLSHANGYEWQ
jgi:DNA-binding MarR family transcriptional regulator